MNEKTALILGATSGVGLGVARTLAKRGDRLFLIARGRERLEKVAKELGAISITGDFSDFAVVEETMQSINQECGILDYLAHCGAYEVIGSIADLSGEELEQAISTNLLGNLTMLRQALPLLRKSKSASVVIIGSVGAERASKDSAAHNLCKAGLLGMVRAASVDLGKHNIRVNMVSPGWVKSDGEKQLISMVADMKNISEAEVRANICANVPLDRMADPIEVANVVEFLFSEKASYITGANIPVDGGCMNIDAGISTVLG